MSSRFVVNEYYINGTDIYKCVFVGKSKALLRNIWNDVERCAKLASIRSYVNWKNRQTKYFNEYEDGIKVGPFENKFQAEQAAEMISAQLPDAKRIGVTEVEPKQYKPRKKKPGDITAQVMN